MGGSIKGTELSLSTSVKTFAGDTSVNISSGTTDNDNATPARFKGPLKITTDGKNLYVADNSNRRIRQIE